MKSSPEKSSSTAAAASKQTSSQPFFAKAGGGNFFAPAASAAPAVQMKMAVNQPGDEYEQEADEMADKVMRMPEPEKKRELPQAGSPAIQTAAFIQRQEEPAEKEEEQIQAKEQTGQAPQVTPNLEARLQSRLGHGQPLPEETRTFMEPRFDRSFEQVQVHADADAVRMNRELNAQAFTHKQDVFFGAGRYNPESGEGKQLLAHELTHVVQQEGVIQRNDGVHRLTFQHHPEQASQKPAHVSYMASSDTLQRSPDSEELESAGFEKWKNALFNKPEWKTLGVPDDEIIHTLLSQKNPWGALDALKKSDNRQALFQSYKDKYKHTLLEDFFYYTGENFFRKALETVDTDLGRHRIDLLIMENFFYYAGENFFRMAVESVYTDLSLRQRIDLLLIHENITDLLDRETILEERRLFADRDVVDAIRTATNEQRADLLKNESFIDLLRHNLEPGPLYEARKLLASDVSGILLQPEQLRLAAKERIEEAMDEKAVIYDVFLDLPSSDRKQLYGEFKTAFLKREAAAMAMQAMWQGGFELSTPEESPFILRLEAIVYGTEAEAGVARLEAAGSPEEIASAIARIKSSQAESERLKASIEEGPDKGLSYNIEALNEVQERLEQIGVPEDLNELLQKSQVVTAIFSQFKNSPREGMAQSGRLGLQLEYAGYQIVHGENTLINVLETLTPLEPKLRDKVVALEDVSKTVDKFAPEDKKAIEAFARNVTEGETTKPAPTPEESIHTRVFMELFGKKEYLQLIEYVLRLSENDRLVLRKGPARRLNPPSGDDKYRVFLGHAITEGFVSLDTMKAVLGDATSGGTIQDWRLAELAFQALKPEDKRVLRRGYFLYRTAFDNFGVQSDQYKAALAEARRTWPNQDMHAWEHFRYLQEWSGLGLDNLQQLFDIALGEPLEEIMPNEDKLLTEMTAMEQKQYLRQERQHAAEYLRERVKEQTGVETGGLAKTKGRSLWLASFQFGEAYARYSQEAPQRKSTRRDEMLSLFMPGGMSSPSFSTRELSALVYHEQAVEFRRKEYVQAVHEIGQIAATVAAIGVGILVGVLTGGSGVVALGALEGAMVSATAGGATRVLTRKMFEGVHFEAWSAEGGQELLVGAFQEGLGIFASRMASRFTALIGRSGKDASKVLADGIVKSSKAALTHGLPGAFKNIGWEALEGLIEGSLSGALGGVAFTVLDENNWRKGIWQGVVAMGEAVVREGIIGGVTGLVERGGIAGVGLGARSLRGRKMRHEVEEVPTAQPTTSHTKKDAPPELAFLGTGGKIHITPTKPVKLQYPEGFVEYGPARAGEGKALASRGKDLTFVELGAGDLKASIQLAKKGDTKVIAVDPEAPTASAIQELESAGGKFIKGTAESLSPGIADHVFQYVPWRINEAGRMLTGGTWRLIPDTIKLLKPGVAAHFVTEDFVTGEFLATQASKYGLKSTLIETTAGAAAPGASGVGVLNFSGATKVWLVNIYQ